MAEPIPLPIKKLKGNTSHAKKNKDPKNLTEPTPEGLKNLTPPQWMSQAAKAKWKSRAPIYQRIGLLTSADIEKFAHYCEDLVLAARLRKEIRTEGELIKGINKNNQIYELTNPKMSLLHACMQRINTIGMQFGDSPVARTKLSIESGGNADPIDSVLDDDGPSMKIAQ